MDGLAMILHDDLLVDTAWVQELHSPEREGEGGPQGQPNSSYDEVPSGAVLSQRMRAMALPTLPLPWSADDINPVPWRRTVTEWLPGPFMPSEPPAPSVAWPPAPCAQTDSSKTLDIRSLSQAKLLAASRKHNSSFNITDPMGAVLDGVRESAALRDQQRASYPSTLGGNPVKDEYTRAWSLVMKNGPGNMLDEGRKPAIKPVQATRQPSVDAVAPARTASALLPTPAPGAGAAAAAAAAGPKVAYGSLTPEQQRFNTLLASFLEVPVKLPLLAPGAQVLDLKRLYMEVSALGGFKQACATHCWPQLATSLQNESRLGAILKQVYAYYLLPVEAEMPVGATRNARLVEVMEAKVREYGALPSLHSNVKVRATAAKVTKALTVCEEGLKQLATDPPASIASWARQLATNPANQQQQQQQQAAAGPQAAAGKQQEVPQVKQEGQEPSQAALEPNQEGGGAKQEGQERKGEGTGTPELPQQLQTRSSPAVVAMPVMALRFLRHICRNVQQCSEEDTPIQLSPATASGSGLTGPAGGAAGGNGGSGGGGSGGSAPGGASEGSAAATQQLQESSNPSGPIVQPAQPGEGEPEPADPGEAPAALQGATLTWDEAEPLKAFLVSFKQLKSGPQALQQPLPRLKEHYLAQLRGAGGGAELLSAGVPVGSSWATAARESLAQEHDGREDRLPSRKRTSVGFVTPKCGNCRTCSNPSLKKACETNRARMQAGEEPIFHTKEAELAYQAKKAKLEE